MLCAFAAGGDQIHYGFVAVGRNSDLCRGEEEAMTREAVYVFPVPGGPWTQGIRPTSSGHADGGISWLAAFCSNVIIRLSSAATGA